MQASTCPRHSLDQSLWVVLPHDDDAKPVVVSMREGSPAALLSRLGCGGVLHGLCLMLSVEQVEIHRVEQ